MSSCTWRKLENERGFPYYVNESSNIKQWDHPKFTDIIKRLDNCNYIRYSAYRFAEKFRVLQCALYMDEIPLSIISGVFERHKLGATEGSLSLESYDLEAVLSDIYFAANKQNNTNTDIDFATELMMNFLYNVYDKERRDNIHVSTAKLLLAVLSNCKISDLYRFIFQLCADHNNCVTRLKLQVILTKFTSMASYLHEDVNFGNHLLKFAINNCFNNSPGFVGISENSFVSWLESCPHLLAWIPTLHRMIAAELVVHAGKCSVCKSSPLLGLRYRCTKCSSYTQCQHCFLSARINSSHKLSHPMKEYCTEGSSKDFTHMFIKRVCKLLRCSVKLNPAPHFASSVVEAKVLSNKTDCLSVPSETDSPCDIEPLSSPEMQLQGIIRQLELQNRELQQMVLLSNSSDNEVKKYLEEHRLHVAAQIQKLKILKEYLQTAQPEVLHHTKPLKRMESTPMIPNTRIIKRGIGLDMLSPITQLNECSSNNSADYYSQNQTLIENVPQPAGKYLNSMPSYSVKDISTWIGGHSTSNAMFRESVDTIDHSDCTSSTSPVREVHHDLDEVLAKLQQILANNFMLDEALGNSDNGQLKSAVTEVEGMLTSLIDGVENNNRVNSAFQEVLPND